LRFGAVGFARKCRRLAVFHCSGGQGNKERGNSLFLAFFVDMQSGGAKTGRSGSCGTVEAAAIIPPATGGLVGCAGWGGRG